MRLNFSDNDLAHLLKDAAKAVEEGDLDGMTVKLLAFAEAADALEKWIKVVKERADASATSLAALSRSARYAANLQDVHYATSYVENCLEWLTEISQWLEKLELQSNNARRFIIGDVE